MGYWTAAAATGRLRLSPSLLPIKPDEILPELLTKRDRETKKLTRRLKFASDAMQLLDFLRRRAQGAESGRRTIGRLAGRRGERAVRLDAALVASTLAF